MLRSNSALLCPPFSPQMLLCICKLIVHDTVPFCRFAPIGKSANREAKEDTNY